MGMSSPGAVQRSWLADLEVGSPLLDLRITESHRGRSIGRRAVEWLTEYLFTHTRRSRIEATTRDDNFAMQKIFPAPPVGTGWRGDSSERGPITTALADAVSYAVLRREHLGSQPLVTGGQSPLGPLNNQCWLKLSAGTGVSYGAGGCLSR
jgi:hypothetical protein